MAPTCAGLPIGLRLFLASSWPHQFSFFDFCAQTQRLCTVLIMTAAARQRDLLPLRLPGEEIGIVKSGLSRGTRQRISRRLRAVGWFREGVETINQLYGKPTGPECPAPVATQAASLARLERMYKSVGPPPQSRPEEALQALLGGMTLYSQDTDCTIAKFDEALVSWPSPGSRPVNVAELFLNPEVSHLLSLAGMPALLADEGTVSHEDPVKPYIDPALASSPAALGRFYGRLHQSHMLSFVSGRHAHTVGVFFVHKKNGKLRLILDTRLANRAFRKPLTTRLPTPAAWSSLEVGAEDTLFTAAGDVADAFHRMALPSHLRHLFRLPAIKCKFVDPKLWPAGCKREDYITPEYATLPMGWSSSLFFCQHTLQSAAAKAGLLESDCIEDRSWIGHISPGRVVHAEYVDNFFVCGTDRERVQKSFDGVRRVLETWGFDIHEVTDAQPVVEGLGLRLDGTEKRVTLTSSRIWKLRLAALAIGRLKSPPPAKVIEKVVGHFTFAMMVRREALSVFSSVYQYIHAPKPGRSLWLLAQAEIVQASSLLPLLSTSWALPWDTVVSATDSSDFGYGVCERILDVRAVASCGRPCEQWRYSVEGAIRARARALGLERDEHLASDQQYACARICSAEFKEIPLDVLSPEAWHIVFSGRWNHHENILRTEGRAMISGIRHKMRALRSQQRRHVVLVDNLSLALGICKGRGSTSLLNSTCRQLCALSLASDCRVHVRWIPSERNSADKPSRQPFSCSDVGTPGSDTQCGDGANSSGSEATCLGGGISPSQGAANRPPDSRHSRHPDGEYLCSRDGEVAADIHSGSVLEGPPGLLPMGSVLPGRDFRLGRSLDCLPQRALRTKPKRQRRGVRFRRLQVQAPPVRKERVSDPSPGYSSTGGVQEPGSTANEVADSPDRVPRYRGCAACSERRADGYRRAHSVGPTLEARRTDRTTAATNGTSHAGSQHAVLGGCVGPFRGKHSAQQGKCVRRERDPESSGQLRAARSLRAGSFTPQVLSSLSLHRSAAGAEVQRCRGVLRPSRPGHYPSRQQTWRRKRPPSAGHSVEGDQKERALGCGLQCPQVRESNFGSTTSPQGSPKHSFVRGVRGTAVSQQQQAPRGRGAESDRLFPDTAQPAFQAPANSVSDAEVRKHLRNLLYQARRKAQLHRHQVFVEVFAGAQEISKCLRALGFGVVCLDILASPLEDVCHPVVASTLKGWISGGVILGVWLGCPCTTWSIAHSSPIVRTRKYLLGVPHLVGKHHDAVRLGNATMRFSADIIEHCVRAHVPCLLENPHSSKLFLAQPLARLRTLPCCQEFVSDLCQYGTQWRKRTRVCAWNCCSEAPTCRCTGSHGVCSRSLRPHLQLAGRSPQGNSWASIAATYPRKWARQFAKVMFDSATNRIQHRLFKFCSIT